jgi:hypothetical protein
MMLRQIAAATTNNLLFGLGRFMPIALLGTAIWLSAAEASNTQNAANKGKIAMDGHCSAGTSILAALLLAWAALPASAHHSPSAFDLSAQVSKTGTVEKWTWTNPHSWLYIRVETADGSQEIWGFEMGSTGGMIRDGWNAADIKPGDKVTVTGVPGRDGAHVALLKKVQLPSGRVLHTQLDKKPSPSTSELPPAASAPPPGAAINAPSSR